MRFLARRCQAWLWTWAASLVALVIALTISVPSAVAQHDRTLPNAPAGPPEDMRDTGRILPDTLERVDRRNAANASGERGKKTSDREPTCLFPPLTLMTGPAISVQQLQRTAKARDRYLRGCEALRKKNNAEAERLFRRAVRDYSKYGVAWVTLGQLLATEQRVSEARDACSKASVADPSYVPAYLCQADIAARRHAWDEVLKLSARALELDPSTNSPVAYEYHAAANLNLHNLVAAEKSALRAVGADRDHHDPRAHFVLAQVYEAKGDAKNEALQLRQYLTYSGKGPDTSMVEQYLAALERNTAANAADSAAGGGEDSSVSVEREGPPDIDAGIPSVLSDKACPLAQVLAGASNRTIDLIDNMRRFSATEYVEHIEFDRNGKKHRSTAETANYVVEIERGSSGYPNIEEYRAGGGAQRASFVDLGTAAFALIFHPIHIGNFDFDCEGLTELGGHPAWQVHFVEGTNALRSFTAIHIGRFVQVTRFKGRAWISTDSYNVLQIETDLVSPIEEIKLQREHLLIRYAPVEFSSRHIQLWLPESSSLYVAYRGRRYERIHTMSDFQLFSVDSVQADKQPADKVFPFDSARWTPPSDTPGKILRVVSKSGQSVAK